MPASTTKKNPAASTTMIATMTEVIQVSRRVVQVILRTSARTSLANCAMVVFFLRGASARHPSGLRTMSSAPEGAKPAGARGSSPEPGRLAGANQPGKADRMARGAVSRNPGNPHREPAMPEPDLPKSWNRDDEIKPG